MVPTKDRFENGAAVLERYEDGALWIQIGLAGMMADHEAFADLYELMTAYIEAVEQGEFDE